MSPVSWSSEYPWMGFTCPGFILKRVTDLKGLYICKKLYCRVYRLPVEDSCYVIIILCIHTWIILLHVPAWTHTLLHILLLLLSHFSHVWLFVIRRELLANNYWQVTAVTCHVLLQGLFLTQGLNPRLWCLLRLWAGLGEGNGTHSSILPGESHGQRSLAGYSPWGHKESDMTERLSLSLS